MLSSLRRLRNDQDAFPALHIDFEVSYSDYASSVIIDLSGKGMKFNSLKNEDEG